MKTQGQPPGRQAWKSILVRVFGFPATLIHGDTLVLDRWRWLRRRLPKTASRADLIDVGCGSGAFSIGAALHGYRALGLSWDIRNQEVATERARLCKAHGASFQVQDVRSLHKRTDLLSRFDVAVCCETIEHVIDDRKLLTDIGACLKPGGRLLLTTPYKDYRAITSRDNGPFSETEDGWHVRKGYSRAMLSTLCEQTAFVAPEFSFCSGFLSQKVTFLFRVLGRWQPLLAWGVTLPLRVAPPLLDWIITPTLRWPWFSIGMVAFKPE